MIERNYQPPFEPGRTDPCFCGSGRRFKACCGSMAPNRPPPHGVMLERGYLAAAECEALIEHCEAQERSWLKVVDEANSTPDKVARKRDDSRVTQTVTLSDEWQQRANDWVRQVMLERVEPAMDCRIEWFEKPQILRYEPGGFYRNHADSMNYDVDEKAWYRTLDRDVSLLMYLNGDYEGGNLRLTRLNYTLHPGPGDLLVFPSDHRYQHQAEPLHSGIRYALVSWAAQEGSLRVRSRPPETAIPMR